MASFERAMVGLAVLGALLTGAFHLGRRVTPPAPTGVLSADTAWPPKGYTAFKALSPDPSEVKVTGTAFGVAGNGGVAITIATGGATGGNGGAFTGTNALATTLSSGDNWHSTSGAGITANHLFVADEKDALHPTAWRPVSGTSLPPGVRRTDPTFPRTGDIQQTEENGVRQLWRFDGRLWRPYPSPSR